MHKSSLTKTKQLVNTSIFTIESVTVNPENHIHFCFRWPASPAPYHSALAKQEA